MKAHVSKEGVTTWPAGLGRTTSVDVTVTELELLRRENDQMRERIRVLERELNKVATAYQALYHQYHDLRQSV